MVDEDRTREKLDTVLAWLSPEFPGIVCRPHTVAEYEGYLFSTDQYKLYVDRRYLDDCPLENVGAAIERSQVISRLRKEGTVKLW